MNHFMLKSLKIGFWFLMPFFFISNSDVEPKPMSYDAQNVLAVRADGAFQELLNGKVTFETSEGVATNQAKPFSSLSFNFETDDQEQEHLMGFVIKKQCRSKEFAIGEYKLTKHIKGFLNNFEGVFAYADIKSLGDKPLFAKQGKLVITQMEGAHIRGYLDVQFADNDLRGNEINVKGNFRAVNVSGN
ncbi:MAG: hypothetical protein WBM98_03740 [Maribacter sp.]|uniref:hypothetical protein n=1 Tax=Maribacter sp. TaxID=1897614 RepID=UPI003C73D26F